ncbi:MAG: sensor histidine kinase [Burkholderiales bacterium]
MTPKQPLLRKQLLKWLFVPLSLLLSVDALISYWVALSFAERAYDRSLVEIARDLSLHLRRQNGRVELDLPEAARRILLTDPEDQLYFEVSADEGPVIAGARLPKAPGQAKSTNRRESLYNAVIDGAPVRVVEMRADPGMIANAHEIVIRVAETENRRTGLAREILLSVLLPQVLLMIIAGVVVWLGVVRGLAPLERIRKAVAARSARDFSPVSVTDVPGELHPLLDSINALLGRLEAVLTLESRFIADAAHQLKTPVAGLQAQLELARREQDVEPMRKSVARSIEGLERLARLSSQLLSLARNEPEAASAVRLEPLDIKALAFEAAARWVPEALRKHIDLGFEGPDQPIMIRGEPGRLHELLDNLLDNAVRYTREGGHVTVRASAEPNPTVAVSDDGPSIPAQERERVFERFHRLLGSPRDGSGLGLAIAREIAQIHGAEIGLSDDIDGVGNTFSVSFPKLS